MEFDIDEILDQTTLKYPDGDLTFQNELQRITNNLQGGYHCNICNKTIKHKANFKRHQDAHKKTFKCFLCDRKFNRLDSVKRHERGHLVGYNKTNSVYSCKDCGQKCDNYTSLFSHMQTAHPGSIYQMGGGNVKTSTNAALDDAVQSLTIYPSEQNKFDLLTFFSNVREHIMQNLRQRCDMVKHIKWYLVVQVEFIRETLEGERDTSQPYFKSKTYVALSKDAITDDDLNEAFQRQFASFDVARGSGWTLKQVLNMEVCTVQYKPINGSSYIDIPKTLKDSHAVINIQNKQDHKCFVWSILAHLFPQKHNAQRVSNYLKYENTLNMNGISCPVQIKEIPKFEQQNDFAVNVIGFEDGNLFPIYISKHKDKAHEVDLLYITKNQNAHFCYIKNLNRLLARTKCRGNAYKFCRYCFQGFTSQRVLDKHKKYCSKHDAQHVEFPVRGEDDLVEFDDYSKQMRVPFVIYCDFEAFSQKVDTCLPNPTQSSTTTTANFEPSGFGFQVLCTDKRYTKPPVIYRGSNVVEHLIESLLQEEKNTRDILDKIEPLIMTTEDEEIFETSSSCFICNEEFSFTSGKVRDHCHVSGKFRGAACSNCNLNFQHPSFIPIFFHNLRGYDGHLLMQAIGKFKAEGYLASQTTWKNTFRLPWGHFAFWIAINSCRVAFPLW